jgi:hypothetical protein
MSSAKDAIELIRSPWWATKTALAVCAVLVFGGVLTWASNVDLPGNGYTRWIVALAAAVATVLFWLFGQRIPRVPNSRVGIVIAIVTDDEAHARQIRADFVDTLRQLLRSEAHKRAFSLVEFPAHIAIRLLESENPAAFAEASRASVLIFGRARRRRIAGQDVQVLDLQGGVYQQIPIPLKVAKQLEKELQGVLPSRVVISNGNDLVEFEMTSEWIDIMARYATGLLALVSADYLVAEQMLVSVQQRIPRRGQGYRPPIAKKLQARLPALLIEIYRQQLHSSAQLYFLRRDVRFLADSEVTAEKILALVPADYGALLTKAMCAFVLRHDVGEAHATLDRCKAALDAAWRYSKAFLCAFDGDMFAARTHYAAAFRHRRSDPTVAIQCEEFIQLQIERWSDKHQLHFCQALINLSGKVDLVAARRDFELFLTSADERLFREEFAIARLEIERMSNNQKLS